MNHVTIAIVGAGSVGSTIAYSLIMANFVSRIALVDINKERCQGEIDDLTDAQATVASHTEIFQGTLQDASQADIIVIAAGVSQKVGESRLDLLKTNKKVIESIVAGLKPIQKNAIIIVVTNPIDLLTHLVVQSVGLPHNQIFGSGTLLDTQRLKSLMSKRIAVDPQSINLFVIGEHGDSQIALWSTATVGGVSNMQQSFLFGGFITYTGTFNISGVTVSILA